jgi:hypothetical protein
MKKFEELSQDQQLRAVKNMADSIIYTVLEGLVPPCFQDFTYEIDAAFNENMELDSIWSVEPYLRSKIESIPAMKLAMLHEAGKMAKKVFYLEEGDVAVRIR